MSSKKTEMLETFLKLLKVHQNARLAQTQNDVFRNFLHVMVLKSSLYQGSVGLPEVEGGCVHNDIAGQREGLCCEQRSQREIQRPKIK